MVQNPVIASTEVPELLYNSCALTYNAPMPFSKSSAKWLGLCLVIAASACLAAPFMHFQGYLAQGDHGRDLYAFEAVNRGQLPYKDFWWVYGPLMPYYYGLLYKIFGMHISTALLGKTILRVLAAAFIYLSITEIASLTAAFLTACWFTIFFPGFFFTYNHIGGIAMVAATAFCLLAYIQRGRTSFAFGALAFSFILSLIKINFGLAGLAVALITVVVTDHVRHIPMTTNKKFFYILGMAVLPLLLLLIYWSLLKTLTLAEIRQCLPYLPQDHPYNISLGLAIKNFFFTTLRNMGSTLANLAVGIVILFSWVRTCYLFMQKDFPRSRKITVALAIGMLTLFYVANMHEYLKSGVWYRTFWAQPLSMMISFVLIDTALQSAHGLIRRLVFVFIAILAFLSWYPALGELKAVETPAHWMGMPRAEVYVANSPSWIATVRQTTGYLNKTLKPNELFFALPYDCLYYYLTGKPSPTRQLIFFQHIHIPPQQERSVIADLEKHHVNYILLSSRGVSHTERGLGILGKDYCPLIAQYIEKNFKPVVHFGDWTDEPGWAWNHGTVILKRK